MDRNRIVTEPPALTGLRPCDDDCQPRLVSSSTACGLLDLPLELLEQVCIDLSVFDICSLRVTNSTLANSLTSRSIWYQSVADILAVKPMLRLQHALADMDSKELMRQAARLARYERDFGRVSRSWEMLSRLPIEPPPAGSAIKSLAKFVPGGNYVLWADIRGRKLMIFDFVSSASVSPVSCLLGPFEHEIRAFEVYPCSASDILLMISDGHQCYSEASSTRILIYRCNPLLKTHHLLDEVVVDGLTLRSFLNAQFAVAHWRNRDNDYRVHVRDHVRGLGTGTLRFEGFKYTSMLSCIAVVSTSHIILANKQIVRIYDLPSFKVTGVHPGPVDPHTCSLICKIDQSPNWVNEPRIVLPPGGLDANGFMPAFGVWWGARLHEFSHSNGRGSYAATQTSKPPKLIQGSLGCPSDSTTVIFGTMNTDTWPMVILPIGHGPKRERAELRLSAATSSGDRTVYAPPFVGRRFLQMSFDEESARLLLLGLDAGGELCAHVYTLVI